MRSIPSPAKLSRRAEASKALLLQKRAAEEQKKRMAREAAILKASADAHRAREMEVRCAELRSQILTQAAHTKKRVQFTRVPTGYLRELRSLGFALEISDLQNGEATGTVAWGDAYSVNEKQLWQFSSSSASWLSSYSGQKFLKHLFLAFSKAAEHGKRGAYFLVSGDARSGYSYRGKAIASPEIIRDLLMALGYEAELSVSEDQMKVTVLWQKK